MAGLLPSDLPAGFHYAGELPVHGRGGYEQQPGSMGNRHHRAALSHLLPVSATRKGFTFTQQFSAGTPRGVLTGFRVPGPLQKKRKLEVKRPDRVNSIKAEHCSALEGGSASTESRSGLPVDLIRSGRTKVVADNYR